MSLFKRCLKTFLLLCSTCCFANDNTLNVYSWSQEIPYHIIAQFEKETGIKVNCATFESNEMMYAKVRASKIPEYDIIEPSSYYVDRMRRLNLLEKLDRTKLSNFKNIDPEFLNPPYDPQSFNSIPFVWGITGIVINKNYFPPSELHNWADLLNKRYLNQLMILDDPREAFSMALLMLGYSINDNNPEHIKQAYQKLESLLPNIRLFNTDAVISILIDEDATIGLGWNGDVYKAQLENPNLRFIFPAKHFEIWVDNFALLKSAKHKENAYRFLNYLLRADVAKEVSLAINYSTANLAARNLLPSSIKDNPMLYPSHQVLSQGEFEIDIGDKTFSLYEKYWEQLKMGA